MREGRHDMRKEQLTYEGEEQSATVFWYCEICGGTRMRHVQITDRHGNPAWHNRCLECGHDSEYIPSPERIAYEAARIRAETGRMETDDNLEKFWRTIAAELGEIQASDDECALEDPCDASDGRSAVEL